MGAIEALDASKIDSQKSFAMPRAYQNERQCSMDIDKLAEHRDQLAKDRKQWEDAFKKCIDDLIKAENFLEQAGQPNPGLEKIVKNAQKALENTDQARKNIDEGLAAITTLLLSLNR